MERNTQNKRNALPKLTPETEAVLNTLPGIVRHIASDAHIAWHGQQWTTFTGQAQQESFGSDWQKMMHPDDKEIVIQTLTNSYNNQQPYGIEYRIRDKVGSYHYYLDKASPMHSENGDFVGLVSILTYIQDVNDNQKQRYLNLRNLVESAPFPIGVYTGPEMKIILANKSIKDIFAKGDDVIGKFYPELLPELEGTGIFEQLRQVYETGIPFESENKFLNITENGINRPFYFNYIFTPLFDEKGKVYGVMNTAADVTELNLAKINIEQSEKRFKSLIEEAPVATCLFTGRDLKIEIANEEMIRIWGKGNSVLGKPFAEALPELEGQPFLSILDRIFDTGETFQAKDARADIVMNGKLETFYFDYTYKPLFDSKGNVYGIMDMAIDVTDTVLAKQKTEETEASLRDAVELAELATWSLNVKKNTFTYSARFMEWLGFSDDTKNMEEAYNPLPEEFKQQVAEKIQEALKSRTGTYRNEHPIINRTTGQTRIISAQAQVFYDTDGNPEFLRGSAQDVTQERELQQRLEYEVKKRTEELQQANAGLADAIDSLQKTNDELAQFAYIASHDLQEPIRKISIFSKMLEDSLGNIDSQSRNYLGKINTSTGRMMNLIHDVLAYSQLAKEQQAFEAVDLNVIIQNVLSDFDLIIEQKKATIAYNELPVIEAIPLQMSQLFANLISNSLKYSRNDFNPIINITASSLSEEEAVEHGIYETGNYYKLEFRDNGIGFDQEHATQIFNIFQRLHGKTEYDGTGIGLAICKKITQNHHGSIYAVADSQKGALFVVLLPLQQAKN